MSLRQISKEALIEAMENTGGSEFDAFLAALKVDRSIEYTVTDSPAEILRKALWERYAVMRRRGRLPTGDVQLIEHLDRLTDTPIIVVALNSSGRHMSLFLEGATLQPVGVVALDKLQDG